MEWQACNQHKCKQWSKLKSFIMVLASKEYFVEVAFHFWNLKQWYVRIGL